MTTPSNLFAVTGNPVLHSLSPAMQNAAFHAVRIPARYTRLGAESANEALQTAAAIGIAGLNVTAPFKEEMARLMDTLDSDARRTGAVNTVQLKKGNSRGFNTDLEGIRAALQAHRIPLKGARAVVLGGGGAAKAAVLALRRAGAVVTIANRTVQKAASIARELGCSYSSLKEPDMRSILPAADILISTASTVDRIIPVHLLRKGMVVLDANYSGESMLVKDARKAGCLIIDGREWLLYQGAKAFEIFTGRKAPIAAMRTALYAQLSTLYPPTKTKNIALIGFMGSGKTTVGKALAKRINASAVDIDRQIEKNTGLSIPDIFERKGESHFRQQEQSALRHALRMKNAVIACGGGAILAPINRAQLRLRSTVVWLWASPDTVFRRIAHDHARPLLNVPDREQVAHRLIQSRRALYGETADILLNTENRTPARVAQLIVDEMQKMQKVEP